MIYYDGTPIPENIAELCEREMVIAQARRWVGTPYHHMADILGVGIDCGMLLVRAFVDAGVVPPFDPRPYARDFFLHRDEESYLGWVTDRACETDDPIPGDVVVFRHGRSFSHGGIIIPGVGNGLRMIHASAGAKLCLEEDIAGSPFAAKPHRFFNPWKGYGVRAMALEGSR